MTFEVPILRLGLAGFTADQQECVQAAVQAAALPTAQWSLAPFADADAWWVDGARSLLLPDGMLRVGPGTPVARSIHLDPRGAGRPIAFARPLPAGPFEPVCAFDAADRGQMTAMLGRFSAWLRPLVAQFSLASSIIEHQAALGGGTFQVLLNGVLIAVVDMRGDVGVLPTAGPAEFEEALWRRADAVPAVIPDHFARISMSQLMWNFATRSRRDLLPAHYRSTLLYFRRPPRLAQRLLRDSHLLLLRELAAGCGTLEELQRRTGLGEPQLAHDLAALYLVGAITSNPKRAAEGARRHVEVPDSILSGPPSGTPLLDSSRRPPGARPAGAPDMTAPVPLRH